VAPDVLRLLLQHGCVVNGDILKSQAKGRNEDYKSLEIMLNYVDDAVIAEEPDGRSGGLKYPWSHHEGIA